MTRYPRPLPRYVRALRRFVRWWRSGHPTPDFVIEKKGRAYLLRWNVATVRFLGREWASLKIHEFLLPDQDEDPHDHPWPWLSVVVKGTYYEDRYTDDGTYRGCWRFGDGGMSRVNRHRATDPHKVRLIVDRSIPGGDPVVLYRSATTVFVTGPRRRVWGFVDPEGDWTEWTTYLGIVGNPADRAEDVVKARPSEPRRIWKPPVAPTRPRPLP